MLQSICSPFGLCRSPLAADGAQALFAIHGEGTTEETIEMMRNGLRLVCTLATVAVTLTLLSTMVACSGRDTSPATAPAATESIATEPATTAVPSSAGPTTVPSPTEAATTPTTTEPAASISTSDLAAALELDPAEIGGGFVVAPADAPDLAAKLEQTRIATAAQTEACAELTLLTATPDFSRVFASPASDVVTVHVYIVDPPTEASPAFERIAGNVDQVAECLLAIGSAGLDVFFGGEGNEGGITGGTQRLVGSVAPPAEVATDGAVAFDTKTDLQGATPITIDGKFIVFRVGGLLAVIEGGSPTDASGPADRGAQVVAERLAALGTPS